MHQLLAGNDNAAKRRYVHYRVPFSFKVRSSHGEATLYIVFHRRVFIALCNHCYLFHVSSRPISFDKIQSYFLSFDKVPFRINQIILYVYYIRRSLVPCTSVLKLSKKILPADPNEYGVNPKYYAN